MCSYSMINDHFYDKWKQYLPPNVHVHTFQDPFPEPIPVPIQVPTQAEIDEFRKLLERAREYDARNNEPHCELEEKKQKIRDLAKQLGIEDKLKFLDD